MLKRRKDRLREITPAEFRRMESDATKVTADLAGMFQGNFRAAINAIETLLTYPDFWDATWRRRLYRLSHDLKGLGGTFNYGLATTVGDSLCGLIRNDALPGDHSLQRRILAHVAALKAILQFDLKGDGGRQGDELLATLGMEPTKRQAN
ncbi:MAG TPA: hypothetical protein VGQ35_05720 [Dongiaceae bacterium]|jgi:hypothetical protein|nr:hypothetical protein [Dongiaceae bacterium]